MSLFVIEPAAFMVLHRDSLLDDGLECGAWDEMLLAAALDYPLKEARLSIADVAAVASAYAIGMLRYRPFCSGNQRAAFLALGLFLYANGWQLDSTDDEAISIMRRVACGEVGEDELANWIRRHL